MSPLSFPHGFYAGEWQKSPIPFGFSGSILERVSIATTVAGTNNLDASVVPAGELWMIQLISIIENIVVATSFRSRVVRDGGVHNVSNQQAPTVSVPYIYNVEFVLQEGDNLRVTSFGDPGGGNLIMDYIGYRIDIDQ